MWQNLEYREKVIKAVLKSLFKRPTKLEEKGMILINNYHLPFTYCGNGSLIIGGKNPDAYENNGQKICLEFANKREKSIKRKGRTYATWQEYEKQRIEHFVRYGWKCVVLWEDEFKNILDKIMEVNRNV